MATAPVNPNLPIFYKDLIPLNTNEHVTWKSRGLDSASFSIGQHAIPLTIDEFVGASRSFPIIFSSGENSVPLALLGMNEGVNVFVDDKGMYEDNVYLPAYLRRYPFMLAKLRPESEELSLCFDPQSGALGKFEDGDPLFEDGAPSETTKGILKFCEEFEQAGARTQAFMADLEKMDLLMDGELAISQDGSDNPFVYRGFRMVNEEKLRNLRGDELRKINLNGMLPLLFAHLFSLQLVRNVFARQMQLGKVPQQA